MRTFLPFFALIAVPASAAAQQRQDHGWPLDMDGDIRIHNYNGSVTLVGWERDSVNLTAIVAGNQRIFGGGSRRGIKAGVDGVGGGAAPLATLTLHVPTRARVSIRGAATTVTVSEFAGSIDASTLGGRISVTGPVAEATLETMDGDIDVESSPAWLRARTATGRITWSGASDDVSLTTVSGAITIPSGTLFRGRVESILGDLKFTGAVKPDGRVTFDSHAGDIVLSLQPDTRATLTLDAPRATVLKRDYARAPGKEPPVVGIPAGGSMAKVRPAEVVTRSFKGRVLVTQP